MAQAAEPQGDLAPRSPAGPAILAVVREGHEAVLAAERDVLATGDAEAIHGLRNGWRALRAALWLMARLRPSAELGRLRDEAGHAAAKLAAVREWDVFIAETLPAAFGRRAATPHFEAIAKAAKRRRTLALANARRALRSVRSQRLHHDLAVWIESADRAAEADDDPRLADFAAETRARLHRRTRKRGRHFGSLDTEALHRLRLAAKRLRDVGAIFDRLPGLDKAGRRGRRRLAALLTALGRSRDRAAAGVLAAPLMTGRAGSGGGFPVERVRDRQGEARALRDAWRGFRDAPARCFRPAG